jgi:hypothetical protein
MVKTTAILATVLFCALQSATAYQYGRATFYVSAFSLLCFQLAVQEQSKRAVDAVVLWRHHQRVRAPCGAAYATASVAAKL